MREVQRRTHRHEALEELPDLLRKGEGLPVTVQHRVAAVRPAQPERGGVVVGNNQVLGGARGHYCFEPYAALRRPARVSGSNADSGIASAPASVSTSRSPSDTAAAARSAVSGKSGSGQYPSGTNTRSPQKRSAP